MKKTLICLIFISILSAPSLAIPTLNSPTGLPGMPTAELVKYKEIAVGADYGGNLTNNPSNPVNGLMSYKVNLGIFNGMEAGVMGGSDNDGSLKEGVFLNLKFGLSSDDTSAYPLKLAVGVENLTSRTNTDIYMVGSKVFNLYGRKTLHFGFMGDFPGDRFRPLGMLGLTYPFSGDSLELLTNLLAGETIFQVDAGLRFYINPTFAVSLVGLNMTDPRSDVNTKTPKSVFAGVTWKNPF